MKLLLLDCDGVLTDGTKFYDQNHKTIAKRFNDRDFTAIKRFKAAGIQVALLSADPWNKGMAKERKLDFWDVREFAPNLDKSKLLPEICKYYLVDPTQICYIGDDFWDNTLLFEVGYKFCPNDACYTTQEICGGVGGPGVLLRKGGEGCIDALYHIFREQLVEAYPDDNS